MQIQSERKGFIVLAVAGVLALILGIWRVGYNITSPFKLKPLDQNAFTESNIFDSQNKDTDGDGLTDFDETNLYNTSPYLEDTDSDGKWDGDEIKIGSDPNCPEGKICGASDTKPATSQAIDLTGGSNAATVGPSADDIRKMLLDGGVSESDLNKLDDKALMQIYEEALKESQ